MVGAANSDSAGRQVRIAPRHAHRRAALRLIGPVGLTGPDGVDRTPAGVLRKAMLAVLALSTDGCRSRALLQDMFWGASDPARAAGSLRTALSTLRHELTPLGDVLRIDGQSVKLNLSAFDVDVLLHRAGTAATVADPDGPDLLEGIDLAGADREGFEDWLRIERSRWVDYLDAPTPAAPGGAVARMVSGGVPARGGIGLLPVVADASALISAGDALLDMIAVEAKAMLLAEIYDYRDGGRGLSDTPAGPAPALRTDGDGPAHLLQLSLRPAGAEVHLSLRLVAADTGRMAWTRTATTPAGPLLEGAEVGGFLSLVLEQLAATLSPVGAHGGAMPGTPYQSLNLMFSLAPDALDRADLLLSRAWEETGAPVHLGLISYLDTFRVGESWGAVGPARDIAALTREGLERGAFDGLHLTTAGYSLFFLTDEAELAGDLMARAVEVSPGQALGWDHLAMYHYFRGNYAMARTASGQAAVAGRFSPLRYAYDTTMSLIAHAEGDMEGALSSGRRALARQPAFGAALKVVTSALGLAGRQQEAAAMAEKIRAQDPTFSTRRMTQGGMRLRDPEALKRLNRGLRLAGLS